MEHSPLCAREARAHTELRELCYATSKRLGFRSLLGGLCVIVKNRTLVSCQPHSVIPESEIVCDKIFLITNYLPKDLNTVIKKNI